MKQIVSDIKEGKFKSAYLIFGEEKYLVRNIKERLIKATCKDGDTMNFTKYAGKDIDVSDVIGNCDTLPFFSDYRVILIEDSGFFKSANETIVSYMDNIPETTIIIFTESEVDKRNKLYKKINKIGYVCDCERMSTANLSNWILKRIAGDGKKITGDTMSYFINTVGNDMENISSELDKLLAYCLNKEVIEKKDIDSICISEITGKVFEMIDAMGNKNQKRALELYYDLIAVREAPMKILYLLARQFNIMLQIKEQLENGLSPKSIASKIGMQPFIVSKTAKQCDNFKFGTIRMAMENCLKLEETVKTGNMDDKMAVELIIIRYSK